MAANSKIVRDFTSGNVTKLLLAFAAPLFLSNLLQIVYNMVDMIIVGQAAGEIGISAVSIGGDVSHFLTFIALGFSSAGQVIISQYIGAGQRKKVGDFIGTMCVFLMLCALVLTVVCVIIRRNILQWMNTPAEAFSEALAYSTTCTVGLVFIYGYNMISAIMRGMGDSRHPFIFISIAAVLNIILDVIFVLFCHMGAFGAALATVISQAVSFISAGIFLLKNKESLGFEFSLASFKLNGEMLGQLIKLGIPMAIKSASVQTSKLFVNSFINSYGVVVSAVAGVGHKLQQVGNQVSQAFTTSGASMVGQNIGAEKYDRVKKIIMTILLINSVIAIVLVGCIVLFPTQVFGIFTSSEAVLAEAVTYVPIAVLSFLGSATRSPSNALANGSGNYKINFAMALLDGVVARVGLGLLFGLALKMGYFGFWLGDALAGFVPLIIAVIFYCSGKWKTRKHVIRA